MHAYKLRCGEASGRGDAAYGDGSTPLPSPSPPCPTPHRSAVSGIPGGEVSPLWRSPGQAIRVEGGHRGCLERKHFEHSAERRPVVRATHSLVHACYQEHDEQRAGDRQQLETVGLPQNPVEVALTVEAQR
eukprot:scaffold148_cov78-Phaeocystis_antarctica.AAC.4